MDHRSYYNLDTDTDTDTKFSNDTELASYTINSASDDLHSVEFIGGDHQHSTSDDPYSPPADPSSQSSIDPVPSSSNINSSDTKTDQPSTNAMGAPSLPTSLVSSSNDAHSWRFYFVTCATLFLTVTALSSIFAFSVFISPIRSEQASWSSDTVSVVLSVQGFLGGVAPFFIGADLQRRGVKFYNVLGVIISAAGLAIGAMAVSLGWEWLYYASVGVMNGLGYGMVYVSTLQHLMKWYPDRPGLAAGLLGLFLGGGAVIWSQLNYVMVTSLGASAALVILAIITFAGSMPFAWLSAFPTRDQEAILLLSHGPMQAARTVQASATKPLSRSEVLRLRLFWQFCSVIFLSLAPGWGMVAVYADMFEQISGCSHADAATYTIIANIAYTAGRLFWGYASDRLGRRRSYILYNAAQAILFALAPATLKISFGVFLFLICLLVTFYGGAKVLLSPTATEMFHRHNANTVVGMSLISISFAALVGPSMMLGLRNANINMGASRTDSYNLFFYVMAGVSTIATIMSASLRPLTITAASPATVAPSVTNQSQEDERNDTLLPVAHPVDTLRSGSAPPSSLEAALLSSSTPRS